MILATCGGTFKRNKGKIEAPNYPFNYAKNVTCEWTIEVASDKEVEVVFLDTYRITEDSPGHECFAADILKVRANS